MTAFMITIKLNDLDDDPKAAEKSAESFCQCVENLLPHSKHVLECEDGWAKATFRNVHDEDFQSMEEIIGHTLWDINTV